LGEERTRQELIPFLEDNHDDDDEVLLALAEELGKFVPLVGGPTFSHTLLPILETLASVDETVVRNKASESLVEIGASMSADDFEQHFIPVLESLIAKEWPARVSATSLLYVSYEKCKGDSRKKQIRNWFTLLTKDETPMVRRASAHAFCKLVTVIEPGYDIELLPVFQKLTEDDQDSVRLISVEACGALAKVLKGNNAVNEVVVPILLHFASDQSWRVRHQAALQMADVAGAAKKNVVQSLLLTSFLSLLKDCEAEVRAVAASCVSKFSHLLSKNEIIASIIPCCEDLANDSNQYVRISIASAVTELSPLVGKDVTGKNLLPIFLELLKDENPEARLGIIGKLDSVGKVIGVDLLSSSLMPAIEDLSKDEHWRVRLAIISHVPLLSQQLGPNFLNNQLIPQCIGWLEDKVYSIREAAIETLQKLATQFGSKWAQQHVVPSVLGTLENTNYLYRITGLHTIAALIPHMESEAVESDLVPAVAEAARNDPVPNVRFNAAKVFQDISSKVSPSSLNNVIRPCLVDLQSDSDVDVRYFASQGLQQLQ